MAKIAYHVFKKPKKTREGKEFYRWYYYYTFVDMGRFVGALGLVNIIDTILR